MLHVLRKPAHKIRRGNIVVVRNQKRLVGGGACHLITYAPDEGFEPGDVVAFRCEDCHDRWDIVLTAEDIDEDTA